MIGSLVGLLPEEELFIAATNRKVLLRKLELQRQIDEGLVNQKRSDVNPAISAFERLKAFAAQSLLPRPHRKRSAAH